MRRKKQYRKAFGIDEYGFPTIPSKYSNIKISRIKNFKKMGGCDHCFPHGIECTNSAVSKVQKSWKQYRKKQYKTSNCKAYYNSKKRIKHVGFISEFFI